MGLCAVGGYLVAEILVVLINDVFFLFPLYAAGSNNPQPLHVFLGQLTSIAPLIELGLIAALGGGALALVGRGSAGAAAGAQPGSAQPQQTQPRRRFWPVGLLTVALGLLTSLGAIGATLLDSGSTPPPTPALIILPLIIPALSMVVALFLTFRRLGVREGLSVFGLMVCSLALLVAVLLTLTSPYGDSTLIILSNPAIAPSVFGVALGLGAVFGRPGALLWRWRAAIIGALLGVGFALPFVAFAILIRFTPPGPCSGEGCGLGLIYLLGVPALLFEQSLEGLALALVGATLGGWLRASR